MRVVVLVVGCFVLAIVIHALAEGAEALTDLLAVYVGDFWAVVLMSTAIFAFFAACLRWIRRNEEKRAADDGDDECDEVTP